MSMEPQVNKICKSGYFHIRNIWSIRKNLNMKDTKTLIHAFVTSVLDNGNSLLYRISKKLLNKLQVLQNSAARVVVQKRKFDHITETRKELHWLPIEARIKYKLLTFVWKSLNNISPSHISNMLIWKEISRNLRRLDTNTLVIPRTNLITFGDRAFEKAAPVLWNRLPIEIRNAETLAIFQSRLKTSLFIQYYE